MVIGSGGYGACGDELVAALTAASEALQGLPGSVHRLTGSELSAVLTVVDQVGALCGAGRFTLTAEAVERGDVAASQAGSTQQWVADRCPTLEPREAGVVAKAVRELAGPRMAEAHAAVRGGRLSVSAGCVIASEWRQLAPLVEPGAEEVIVGGLVAIGASEGVAGVRALRPVLLARYGLGEQLQVLEDAHRGLTVLSCGHDIGGGVTEYRMRLAAEARAVVEAALNAASAPRPVDGERDPRTVEQRRGDALVDLCRRAVSCAGSHASTLSLGTKATVMVTIGLADLQERSRAGTLVGGVDAGTLLGPETVRRLVCDAAVIPAVVGNDGQILHLGRSKRWFTTSQVKALWLRDRHCTFPGCRTPASWCDAHHVRHWLDGGSTDVTNGVLLCERHHTIVHRDRLNVTVSGSQVVWDRTRGSYDEALGRDPPGEVAS